MSAPFVVPCCRNCGHLSYPPRILCPQCGANDWGRKLAESGVVEEITVRRPVFKRRQLPWGNWLDQAETHLAAVMTDVGRRIVCRVPEGTKVGDRVSLTARGSTAIAVPGQVVEAEIAPATPAPADDGAR